MDVCKAIATRMFVSGLFVVMKIRSNPVNIAADLNNLKYIAYTGLLFSYFKNYMKMNTEI